MKTIKNYDIQKILEFKEDFSISFYQARTIINALDERGLILAYNIVEGKLYKCDFTEQQYSYFSKSHPTSSQLELCSLESLAAEVHTWLRENKTYAGIFINSSLEKDELYRQYEDECDLMLQILNKTNQIKASA